MPRLVILLALFLVNLPVVHQEWTDHRVATDGEDVVARVLRARTIQGRHLVDYRLPRDADPSGREFSARVDAATYDRAVTTNRLTVRFVPGEPGTNRPSGEVSSPVLLVAAVAADVIALLIGAVWLYRRRHPQELESPPPGPARA